MRCQRVALCTGHMGITAMQQRVVKSVYSLHGQTACVPVMNQHTLGLFWPSGSAPGSASEAKSLPERAEFVNLH